LGNRLNIASAVVVPYLKRGKFYITWHLPPAVDGEPPNGSPLTQIEELLKNHKNNHKNKC